MKVTLSEFVVKSLIEEQAINLIYVQPKYLVHFLTGLKHSAKNYGVEAELKAVLNDPSAIKFTELYEEICATVATFGGKPPKESVVIQSLNPIKETKVKEFQIWALSKKSSRASISRHLH